MVSITIFLNAGLVSLRELDLERTAVGDDGLDVLSCKFSFDTCILLQLFPL
jgi:hypothetical protein